MTNPTNGSALLAELIDAITHSRLSIEEIARRSNVSDRTLYFWLSRRTLSPRITTMEKVALGLDYRIRLERPPLRVVGAALPQRKVNR